MPVAALDRSRIGLDKAEGVERQPQQIGGNLRKAGLVALAVRLGAEHECHLAVRLKADLGAFPRGAPRRFEKAGSAKPAQPAALRRGLPPSGKVVHQEALRHLVEIVGKASAIDRDPETATIWEMADQVAPAQCDRVERQSARRAVDEPLDQVMASGLPAPR